jgi:hypothetical protein
LTHNIPATIRTSFNFMIAAVRQSYLFTSLDEALELLEVRRFFLRQVKTLKGG